LEGKEEEGIKVYSKQSDQGGGPWARRGGRGGGRGLAGRKRMELGQVQGSGATVMKERMKHGGRMVFAWCSNGVRTFIEVRARRSRHMRGSGRRERQRGREGEGGKGREEGERELIRNDTPHGRESARGGSDRQMDTERGGERDTHRERERQGGREGGRERETGREGERGSKSKHLAY
jgi:hypothetical protein